MGTTLTNAEIKRALRDFFDAEPMPTTEKMLKEFQRRQKEASK